MRSLDFNLGPWQIHYGKLQARERRALIHISNSSLQLPCENVTIVGKGGSPERKEAALEIAQARDGGRLDKALTGAVIISGQSEIVKSEMWLGFT